MPGTPDVKMEETYEGELRGIARRVPEGPCIVALLPTTRPLDQAAALANDAAQSIGAARPGHTLLATFEGAPARLDHEIGLEDGPGLTDVLAGRATLKEVAAHGRARRFIYVPAGRAAGSGESLLRSDAWRALAASALARGGTILAFIPPDTFEELMEEGGAPRFDALLRLGSAEAAGERVRRTAIERGARDLGRLGPPGTERDASAPAHRLPPEATSSFAEGADGAEGARSAAAGAPPGAARPQPILLGPSRRNRRRRRRRRRLAIATVVILALAALGAAAVLLSGDGDEGAQSPGTRFAAPDSSP